MIEKDIHLNSKPVRYKEAMECLEVVLERMPRKSEYAKRALLFQATIAKGFDRKLAGELYRKLQSRYPDYHPDIVKAELLELN